MNSSNYFTTLTPLRGIAALLVVVLHADLMMASLVSTQVTHPI